MNDTDPKQPQPNNDDPERAPAVVETPILSCQRGFFSTTAPKNSSSAATTPQIQARSYLASLVMGTSDGINDNLLTFRYLSMTSIGLLTAYGIIHSPLFFRYRTISELPSRFFHRRGRLACRFVPRTEKRRTASSSYNYDHDASHLAEHHNHTHTTTDDKFLQTPQPKTLTCNLRHLSPFEQLLPRHIYNTVMMWHPARGATGQRPDREGRQLLQVQLAAVVAPTSPSWLEAMIRSQARVSCELLAQLVVEEDKGSTDEAESSWNPSWSTQPDTLAKNKIDTAASTALVKLWIRQPGHIFATDVGTALVELGQANPSPDGLAFHGDGNNNGGKLLLQNYSADVKKLQRDAQYMQELGKVELEAAKAYRGMWKDPTVREVYQDTAKEAEFQSHAPWWRKVFRWVMGG